MARAVGRERGRGRLAAAWLGAGALAALWGCSEMPKNNMQATSVLDLWAPPSPTVAAQWAADPYDADKRQRGMLLLANAPFGGERVYVQLYRARLADDDPAVRAVAARALALHGEPEDAPDIAERLKLDPDEVVRRESARALQRIHNPAVVDQLLGALDARKEPDTDTRAHAARALGQYAQPRVVQGLIGSLNDSRLAVNENALHSLRVLTGQDFGVDAKAWIEWAGQRTDLFAQRGEYVFPVFHRDPTIVEFLVPFWRPPNEQQNQRPVGMAAGEGGAAPVEAVKTDKAGG
jgi:hypothetical protein